MGAKSAEAQALLAALDAALAASAKYSGRDLVWSAAERDVLSMIGAPVDRRVELSAAYGRSRMPLATQLKIATELRLTPSLRVPTTTASRQGTPGTW
jgi:hypothetical protein